MDRLESHFFSHRLFSKIQNHKNPKGKAGNDRRSQSISTFYMEEQSHPQIHFFFSEKEKSIISFQPSGLGSPSPQLKGIRDQGKGFPGDSDGNESACTAGDLV